MIEFILNNELINTDLPSGSILLDFIRSEEKLTGTKIGCREGDCGACTVLVGSINKDGSIDYKSVTSCLTPIASIHGKHVVTVEGLNIPNQLSTIQSIFKENNATQCGFCTPGFIVSLTGYSFNSETSILGILDSVSGNICRCTGYKSIEKAGIEISGVLIDNNTNGNISNLIRNKFIPEYFADIPKRLQELGNRKQIINKGIIVGGGTDIYVTDADNIQNTEINLIGYNNDFSKIRIENDICTIGAGITPSDILNTKELFIYFPELVSFFKLISSKQIRNMGTLGGNIVNASPIADLSIFFLALKSNLTISDKNGRARLVLLRDFFKSYKNIDLQDGEIILNLSFKLPEKNQHFNFEKVSKRTHLDIASVNSAFCISISNNNKITNISISAGGVAPIPLLLKNTCAFLKGKVLSSENIRKAHCVLKEEISPISDIRGSEEYKRLLLRQLYYGHFIKLFPEIISISDIK